MKTSRLWPGYHPDDLTHQMLQAYLTMDIQASPEAAQELLEKIAAVQAGKIDGWERYGNAYCLRLFPDYAVIEEDYSDEPGVSCQVAFPVLIAAVKTWLQALARS